jgi:hypothetical protein
VCRSAESNRAWGQRHFAGLRTLRSQRPSKRGRSGKLNKPSTALRNRIEMLHGVHKRLVTILIDFEQVYVSPCGMRAEHIHNGAVTTTSVASWNYNAMPKYCSRNFSEPRLLQINTQCEMIEFASRGTVLGAM